MDFLPFGRQSYASQKQKRKPPEGGFLQCQLLFLFLVLVEPGGVEPPTS
jgi:hypothetical protein